MKMNVRNCRSYPIRLLSTLYLKDMIIDNDPPIERHISVPRDMNQLSCSSFTAGIVEAVLDGLGLVSSSSSHKPCADIPVKACASDRSPYPYTTIFITYDYTH